jgi:hypothetical protein
MSRRTAAIKDRRTETGSGRRPPGSGMSHQWASSSTPQVIMMLDRAGRVIHANCTLGGLRLAPISASVRYGLGVHDIVHPGCAGCALHAAWSDLWDAFDGTRGPRPRSRTPCSEPSCGCACSGH